MATEVTRGSVSRAFTGRGAPVDGAAGTFYGSIPKGALYVDETNGFRYINTGTLAVPVYSKVVTTDQASLNDSAVATVAESQVLGGLPVVYMIPLTAGALADTDVVVTHKVRVIDAYLILRGTGVANTTLQVKNGSTAISNAMAASGSDTALIRAANIDDAAYEIAAAGTLRVTSATGATQPAALVVVTCVRVA